MFCRRIDVFIIATFLEILSDILYHSFDPLQCEGHKCVESCKGDRWAERTNGPSRPCSTPAGWPAPVWAAGNSQQRVWVDGPLCLACRFNLLTPLPIAPSPPWRNLPPLSSLPLALLLSLLPSPLLSSDTTTSTLLPPAHADPPAISLSSPVTPHANTSLRTPPPARRSSPPFANPFHHPYVLVPHFPNSFARAMTDTT